LLFASFPPVIDLSIANGAFPSPFPSISECNHHAPSRDALGSYLIRLPCLSVTTAVGHEGAGIIEAVGADVKTLAIGDKVLLSFAYCGTCQQCKIQQPAYCDTWIERNFGRIRQGHEQPTPGCKLKSDGTQVWAGFFGQSSFARLALVGESSCVKVDPSTDLAALAPLGCGLQTGAGAVFNRLKPTPNSSILIVGVGAVGMGALFAAVASGVQEIIVVDIHDSRLALAESLGATRTINAMNTTDIVPAIRAATSSGQGPMYAVECTGRPASLRDAIQSMCKRGILISCGTPGPGHNAPIE
jgi:aryl-alcohol dehydrogenase